MHRLSTINFEATEGAAPLGGGEDLAPDEGLDDGGEQSWGGVSQEDWEMQQQQLAQLVEYVQTLGPQQQDGGQGQGQPIDPFADNFQEQLDAYIEARTAPLQGFQQELQYDEAEQRALDIITDITSRDGEFLMPESSTPMARNLAEDYLPSMIERYGNGPKAAEAALTEAVKRVKQYEQEVGNVYHERQSNEIATLAGARRQPDTSATGAQGHVTPEGGNELDLVRTYFES